MPAWLEPKTKILPAAQREIWPQLTTAADLDFVLYGGTAIALHLGHRRSLDFDFFDLSRSTNRSLKSQGLHARPGQLAEGRGPGQRNGLREGRTEEQPAGGQSPDTSDTMTQELTRPLNRGKFTGTVRGRFGADYVPLCRSHHHALFIAKNSNKG